jgi:hypothetical protein
LIAALCRERNIINMFDTVFNINLVAFAQDPKLEYLRDKKA